MSTTVPPQVEFRRLETLKQLFSTSSMRGPAMTPHICAFLPKEKRSGLTGA